MKICLKICQEGEWEEDREEAEEEEAGALVRDIKTGSEVDANN